MLWDKKKFILRPGKHETSPFKGVIDHIIVIPPTEKVSYNFYILDSDGDILFQAKKRRGRIDDKDGLPVGEEKQEPLLLIITENKGFFSKPTDLHFTVIFKTREK